MWGSAGSVLPQSPEWSSASWSPGKETKSDGKEGFLETFHGSAGEAV